MPAQTTTNVLLKKYGQRLIQAWDAHKNEAPDVGGFGGECPPGINGIARLSMIKIGTFEKGDNVGEPYFMAMATVVVPAFHPEDKTPVQGTVIKLGPEAICDTPNAKGERKTFEDHLNFVQDHLKLLGVEASQLDLSANPNAIMDVIDFLREQQPYVRFRSWKGEPTKDFPNPRVNYNWQGVQGLENWTPEEAPAFTDRTGGAAASANGAPAAPAPAAARSPAPTRLAPAVVAPRSASAAKPATAPTRLPSPAAAPAPAASPTPDDVDNFEEDLDQLAALADETNDDGAIGKLSGWAEKAGVPEPESKKAANWAEVVELIRKYEETGEEAVGAGEANDTGVEWSPNVTDVYRYRPKDPKTKKQSKTAVDVEVTAVDKAKRTVNLRDAEDPKRTWKNIPWETLESGVSE